MNLLESAEVKPHMRTTTMKTLLAAVMTLAMAAPAAAQEWKTVSDSGGVKVQARDRKGTAIQEFRVQAELDAPASAIQQALTEHPKLPRFMPHVRQSRVLKPAPGGGDYVYVVLSLPMIGARDYVIRTQTDSKVGADGSGEFRSHWEAAPDIIPTGKSMERIRVTEGSWSVKPLGPQKSRVEYQAFMDPGGGIPASSVNSGNLKTLPQTMKAIEAEAKRRAAKAARGS